MQYKIYLIAPCVPVQGIQLIRTVIQTLYVGVILVVHPFIRSLPPSLGSRVIRIF